MSLRPHSAQIAVGRRELEDCARRVEAACGFRFGDVQYRNLEDAVKRRVAQSSCTQVAEYLERLEGSSATAGELGRLLSEFTNTETNFFRHRARFELLTQRVLPALMQGKRQPPGAIRILSAGCSSGEEVYSTIISLLQVKERWAGYALDVTGVDLNGRALEEARAGTYGSWTLRYTPAAVRERYFRPAGDGRWRIADEVKRHASFERANLVEPEVVAALGPASFDVVFCCNVIIYLTDESVERVLTHLRALLARPAFLFLGYTERPRTLRDEFEPDWSQDYVVYRRMAPAPPRRRPPVPAHARAPHGAPRTPSRPVDTRVRAAGSVPPPRRRAVALPRELSVEERYRQAQEHCRLDQHEAALQQVRAVLGVQPFHCGARVLKGYLDGSRGEFSAATDECTKVLDIDPTFAQAYLLSGILLQQQGQVQDAIGEVRKALYLEPDQPLAAFTLGKLYLSVGDERGASTQFAHTVRCIDQRPGQPVAADIPVEFEASVLRRLAEQQLAKLAAR